MKASNFCSSTTNFAASTSVAVSDCTDSTAFLMSSTSASTALTTFTMLAAISVIVAATVSYLGGGHDDAHHRLEHAEERTRRLPRDVRNELLLELELVVDQALLL